MEAQIKYPAVTNLLPHRNTMLLVDRIEEFSPEGLVASRTVRENSPFVDGHFPGYPILPGVILVEMMFQTCGLFGGMSAMYAHSTNGEAASDSAAMEDFTKDLKARSIGIDKLVFKKPVYPNDELIIEVKPLKKFMNFSTYSAKIIDKSTQEIIVKGKLTVFLGKNK